MSWVKTFDSSLFGYGHRMFFDFQHGPKGNLSKEGTNINRISPHESLWERNHRQPMDSSLQDVRFFKTAASVTETASRS